VAKYRRSIGVDLHPYYGGKGRKAYIKVYKNMGFYDICECNLDKDIPTKYIRKRVRPNSGIVGEQECVECGYLVWPLSAVFECDECTEPALSDKYPVALDEEFLCSECS